MTDATDDLDYQLSGEQARFRKADKELWDKQTVPTNSPDELVKYLDSYKVGFYDKAEAKAALRQYFLKSALELIGGYEKPVQPYDPHSDHRQVGRNLLRKELRQAFREMFNG